MYAPSSNIFTVLDSAFLSCRISLSILSFRDAASLIRGSIFDGPQPILKSVRPAQMSKCCSLPLRSSTYRPNTSAFGCNDLDYTERSLSSTRGGFGKAYAPTENTTLLTAVMSRGQCNNNGWTWSSSVKGKVHGATSNVDHAEVDVVDAPRCRRRWQKSG